MAFERGLKARFFLARWDKLKHFEGVPHWYGLAGYCPPPTGGSARVQCDTQKVGLSRGSCGLSSLGLFVRLVPGVGPGGGGWLRPGPEDLAIPTYIYAYTYKFSGRGACIVHVYMCVLVYFLFLFYVRETGGKHIYISAHM